MNCREVEVETPEGYKKDITICRNVEGMPKRIQGEAFPYRDLVYINKYLEYPELYVEIHEINHILHPHLDEYEIRRMADYEYRMLTGRHIDTASDYLEYVKRSSVKRWS